MSEQVELLKAVLEEVRALRELVDNVTQGGDAMVTCPVVYGGEAIIPSTGFSVPSSG